MTRLLLLMLCCAGAGAAQPADTTAGTLAVTGLLRVEAPTGVVRVDGVVVGPAPQEVHVAAGARAVEVREAEPQQWAPLVRDTTVTVIANKETVVRLPLPLRVRIETIPPGADAVLLTDSGEEPLGRTPLVYEAAGDDGHGAESVSIALRKSGYLPQERALPEGSGRRSVLVELQPALAAEAETGVEPWRPEPRPNYYVDAGIGVATLAAAALAIHFKFEADRLDDRGDPTLRDAIERNDTYALVALGAMQVGIGALALRWVLR